MGEIVVRDPGSGMDRIFPIKGEKPTAQERKAIERQLQASQQLSLRTGGTGGGPARQGAGSSMLGRFLPSNITDLEPLTIGGGAMMGARAGVPFGLPGIAAGGALGAAAGSLGQEGLADLGRATGGFGGLLGDDPRRGSGVGGPLGPTSRALNEGALDLAMPSAISAVKGAGKRTALRMIGKTIPDSGQRVAAYSRELDIPLGVENVTESRTMQGVRRVLGRIPLINKEFRKLDTAQSQALVDAKGKVLNEIAPLVTTVADVGTEIGEESFRRTKAAGGALSGLYEQWIARAQQAGARIPSAPIKQVARDLLDSFRQDLPTRTLRQRGTSPLVGPSGQPISVATTETQLLDTSIALDPSVLDFAKQLATLDDMSPRQYQTLQRTINQIIEQNLDNRAVLGQAMTLKAGMESALEEVVGPQELRTQIRGLNSAFSQYMDLLQSPQGRRVARATGGLGKSFSTRTGESDELYKHVFRSKSPQAITDLFRLSGRRTFSRAVRSHIEDAFETSLRTIRSSDDPPISKQIVEIKNLRRQLGFARERSSERQAMQRAMELSDGPSFGQMERFFDTMEAVLSQKEVDVADFMARRVVLGGVRSGVRAINPASIFAASGSGTATIGGAAAAGPLGAAAGAALSFLAVMGTRRATRILTEPGVLKAATSLMDPNLSMSRRNEMLIRLGRIAGEDFVRDVGAIGDQYMQSLVSQQQASAIQQAPESDVRIQESRP